MEFIIRSAKVVALYFIFLQAIIYFGANFEEAKFDVIALIIFWALVFFFMHPYMQFVAMLESSWLHANRAIDSNEIIWKFLSILFFIIAGLCWIFW